MRGIVRVTQRSHGQHDIDDAKVVVEILVPLSPHIGGFNVDDRTIGVVAGAAARGCVARALSRSKLLQVSTHRPQHGLVELSGCRELWPGANRLDDLMDD